MDSKAPALKARFNFSTRLDLSNRLIRAFSACLHGDLHSWGVAPGWIKTAPLALTDCTMSEGPHYLIVDGHSVIFAWPDLRKLHARSSSLAREALVKQLRDYQDWTGVRVVVVFDGKGKKVEATSDPGDVQIFYSRSGQSADAIIERLASKYAKQFELMVATSDSMEAETVHACGAEWISPEALRGLLAGARRF